MTPPPVPYYDHGGITIYHGDCAEILPHLAAFDLMLADPPYGIGMSSGAGKYGVRKWGGANDDHWDDAPPAPELISALCGLAPHQIIWGGNYFGLPPSRGWLVWDKGAGMAGRSFAECELAWTNLDINAKVYKRDPLASGDYRGKVHPTQKPLAVISWCLDQCQGVTSVIDPFMGSGTTLVAAKAKGLRAVGIEREAKYCKAAVERLAQETLAWA